MAVRALEGDFQEVLDAVLRRRGAPATSEVEALGPKLVELSRAYNAGLAGDPSQVPVPLDARIAFSFARDVPKGAAAVRELVSTGALAMPEGRPLRIVDLGAGLGAMTWGIARALGPGAIDALLVDVDEAALGAAEAIAHEASAQLGASAPSLTIRAKKARVTAGMSLPEADVVVLGQVLSELDVGEPPEARVKKHAALIADLLARVVAPDGSLVIVEPALRDRTRHLHAVRDVLAAAGTTIFAPCLHADRCPVLATENDWCHEDLPVDLPPWLVPLAREAGLRWQRLTFSYLVLRRDGRTLRTEVPKIPKAADRFRVISELLRTKGKAELFGCTEGAARLRLRRLDRDARDEGPGAAATATWSQLDRGAIVTVSSTESTESTASGGDSSPDAKPPIDERGRISATAQIDVWPIRK